MANLRGPAFLHRLRIARSVDIETVVDSRPRAVSDRTGGLSLGGIPGVDVRSDEGSGGSDTFVTASTAVRCLRRGCPRSGEAQMGSARPPPDSHGCELTVEFDTVCWRITFPQARELRLRYTSKRDRHGLSALIQARTAPCEPADSLHRGNSCRKRGKPR